ncbi:MAG: hypothetical protein ABSD57_08270 [Verrucomicrobiota bacterium]|jgi:hypothetical protein
MNQETNNRTPNGAAAAALGVVIACLILAVLILVMKHSARPPAIDADRTAARAKALAELRTAESNALSNPGWIDQNRGLVRLPISVALQITENEWQNPAVARSKLVARVEKATTPAPPAPAKPSPFE